MPIEKGWRVYGSCCDSCGEPQIFGVAGAGLERYDDPENVSLDRIEGYWLLCDKCRPADYID